MFYVKLSNCGNPDHGQNPNRPVYGTKNTYAECETIEVCGKACQEYIEGNDLGGGNWTGGGVFTAPPPFKKENFVGCISYNGRFWDKETEYAVNYIARFKK